MSHHLIQHFIIKVVHMHHNLQRNTYNRHEHLHVYVFPGRRYWRVISDQFIGSHKFSPTLMDSCCSERWVLSFLPLFDLVRTQKWFGVTKMTSFTSLLSGFTVWSLTLWMLQPVAIHIVEVATLKLPLAVVGHRNWDERVHTVEGPLVNRKST